MQSYKEFLDMLKSLEDKPKLLLHVCCAPCSSHPLLLLKEYFNITILYSNDNIYPYSEYEYRLNEVIEFTNKIDSKINVIALDYNDKDFYDAIKGLEKLGEKSKRCYECYKLRLTKTAQMASKLKMDYFTTVLSISPHKNDKWINEIGYELEKIYDVKFLYSNFKKDEGYKKSIILSKEYNLYRQDYCGCIFSKEERSILNDTFKKENKN